jgi:hypothetical protein
MVEDKADGGDELVNLMPTTEDTTIAEAVNDDAPIADLLAPEAVEQVEDNTNLINM